MFVFVDMFGAESPLVDLKMVGRDHRIAEEFGGIAPIFPLPQCKISFMHLFGKQRSRLFGLRLMISIPHSFAFTAGIVK